MRIEFVGKSCFSGEKNGRTWSITQLHCIDYTESPRGLVEGHRVFSARVHPDVDVSALELNEIYDVVTYFDKDSHSYVIVHIS